MISKDEIINKYVSEIYKKMDLMYGNFARLGVADKRHMENGFRYAVTESVNVLNLLLDEKPKENKFKNFIDKQLGLKAPTQEDIEAEKIKIEMEKQKLELAKLRAEKAELSKKGGDTISSFVHHGIGYNPLGDNPLSNNNKKKE